jgi:hypothetical protein
MSSGSEVRLFDIEKVPQVLQLGDVVWREATDGYAEGRGVVTWVPCDQPWRPAPFMEANDYQISDSSSQYSSTVTNNLDGQWRLVPLDEQTFAERVWSASLRWRPERWEPDYEDDEPPECISYEWALFAALVDPEEMDHWWDMETPSIFEMAMWAGARLDSVEKLRAEIREEAERDGEEILRRSRVEAKGIWEKALQLSEQAEEILVQAAQEVEELQRELAGQVGNLERIALAHQGQRFLELKESIE